MRKRIVLNLFLLIVLFLLLNFFPLRSFDLLAEKSGSSPESGPDSRIKETYEEIDGAHLDHGSESAGGWGDWGEWWNRIRSAAEWVPSGDLALKDVFKGKTFYSDSRTQQTGTFTEKHKNQIWDDYKGTDNCAASLADAYADPKQDQCEDESTWTGYTDSSLDGANVASANIYKDNRTGLYWSACYDSTSGQGSCDIRTNIFTLDGIIDTSLFAADDGLDAEGGDAVDFCESLQLDADGNTDGDDTDDTDWYLPSQKELMQAYIDGIYNQTSAAFVTTSHFWSSTERSDTSGYAWVVSLYNGYTFNVLKTTDTIMARCVRRD